MSTRFRVVLESIDTDSDEVLSRKIIKNKEISEIETILDLGFRHAEQIELLEHIQNGLLLLQSKFLKDDITHCPQCGMKLNYRGFKKSDFHSVFTDHKVDVRRQTCSNHDCNWRNVPSIKSLFGTNIHPDLSKLQCELGAEHTYRDTQDILNKKSSSTRKINNHDGIYHQVEKIGNYISENQPAIEEISTSIPSKELIIQVDGGYVKSKEEDKHRFEALTSVVYRPTSVVTEGENGRGKITEKYCSASAIDDQQASIKQATLIAAKKQGLNKKTHVTALCDGASNCWNVIDEIANHAGSVTCILDWYHITMKIQNLSIKENDEERIKNIRWHLWRGKYQHALTRLEQLIPMTQSKSEKKKLQELYNYIDNNKKRIVNYRELKKNNKTFTSSIAESTVESLINQRCKGHQHMRWTRKGLHSLLQVRASVVSNDWDKNWQDYILGALGNKKAA